MARRPFKTFLALLSVAIAATTPCYGQDVDASSPEEIAELKRLQTRLLGDFYDALGGERWTDATGWKSLDVCSWRGIRCEGAAVTGVVLTENNLIGSIPETFWSLPRLRSVELKGNLISDASWKGLSVDAAAKVGAIVAAESIEAIDLSENQLTDLSGVGNLPQETIQHLDVHRNRIATTLDSDLFGLVNLKMLHIGFNNIPGPLPTAIGQLTRLTSLQAFDNEFTGTLPSQLGELFQCQTLGLGNNDFSGTLPKELNNMINLRELSLHRDDAREASAGMTGKLLSFGNMPFLSSIYLDGNSLSGSIPEDFLRHNNNTKATVSIGLSDNDLTGELPKTLERFEKLTIDVIGNRLSAIPPELCKLGGWMGGLVEQFKCDAILCPLHTYNSNGRATRGDSVCRPCPGSNSTSLGAMTCESDSQTPQEPWRILAKFYFSLGGKGWTKRDGWQMLDSFFLGALDRGKFDGSSIKYCDGWHGVVCENGEIVQLLLAENECFGQIPSSVFTISSLRKLDLSGNNVQLENFHGAALAPSLKTLILSGVKVYTMDGIGDVSHLESLYIDGLDLQEKLPEGLFALTRLRELDLQHGSFTGSLPTLIGQISLLQILNMYGNHFTGRLPSELGRLTALRSLDLSENAFTGSLPPEFSQMSSLETFAIHQVKTSLTGSLPAFDVFPSLHELNLEDNSFMGSIPHNFLAAVTDMSSEVLVSLGGNRLTGALPSALGRFQQLVFNAEGNSISSLPTKLCENTKWMHGEVGLVPASQRCNAILCPPGTWNLYGKQTSHDDVECLSCPENTKLFGQVSCNDATANKEKEILDILFSATGGRYWNLTHDNWTKPGVSICSREGIVCSNAQANSGVLELHLQNFGLRGTVPSEIWQLPIMRSAGFSGNAVDIDFNGIENAAKLIVLKASRCQLRSLDGLRGAPPRLSEVHLARNQLNGPIPEDIYHLTGVKQLFLNNNHFSGRITSDVSKLSSLIELWLWDNSLTGGIPPEIGALSNLVSLGLNDNAMSGTLPRTLEDMYSLSRLYLARQRSQSKFYGSLLSFSTNEFLADIDLSSNSFSGVLPRSFLAKVDLRDRVTANLSRNKFNGPIPDSWSRFESLNIDLSGNMISEIPPILCNRNGWNNGLVGLLDTCDAILCKPGTFSDTGYLKQVADPCAVCSGGVGGAPYFGSLSCLNPDQREERDTLINFYRASNGTSWLDQQNWMSTASVCDWYGITCNGDGYIESVSLPNNELKGSGDTPSTILSLSNLMTLDLEGNQVQIDLYKTPHSSKLETLRLSGTGINSIYGISRASKLRALHVTNNNIIDIPDEIYSMSALRSVFMSFNSIAGTISKHIGLLSNLEELYMFGNDLTGSIPSELGNLSRLSDLILGGNKLSGSLPRQLSYMQNLHQLSLYDQRGSDLITGPVPSFVQSTNLWYFDVSNNDLTGPLPDDFMTNSIHKNRTIVVNLRNNEVSGTIPSSLSSFQFLDLNLAGNLIEEIPNELCEMAGWIQGNVGKVGNCSSILCPKGTYNQFGQHKPGKPCSSCALLKKNRFLGHFHCENFSSERETLREFFTSAGGEFWTNSTNWMTDAPICKWFGVLCEDGDLQDTSGITSIQLVGNQLSGVLPSRIWKLPSLRSVRVNQNPNLRISFDGIQNAATTLHTLYLSETYLPSLDGISKATSLKTLHMTGIGLKGTFPSELFRLSDTLENLYIAYNQLYGTLPTNLGTMTKIQSFLAFNNDFLSTLPSEIGQMSSLTKFVLSDNLIYGQLPSEISSLPNLVSFSIFRDMKSGPRLSGTLPSFDKLPRLQGLYLQGNSIGGSIPKGFLSSSLSMKVANISSNFLTGEIPSHLGAMSSLKIDVHDNEISKLRSSVCQNENWMDGNVAKLGCDAILCHPGSANEFGRATSDSDVCKNCTDPTSAPFYGSVTCDPQLGEREILLNLYKSLNGDNWLRNDFWGSVTSVCDWYGIACIGGRVVEINLRGNNLVGLPGADLFLLKKLRILWMHSNPISFSFENIGRARNLESLRLDSTRLRSLRGIVAAKSLVDLDVRFSSVKGPFPIELLELKNLRTLLLRGNRISGALPDSFSSLQYLISIDLGSNMLTGRLPDFSKNMFLSSVDLSNNSLTGALPRGIFSSLDSWAKPFLNLAMNQLTGVVPEEIGRFSDFRLYLRDNKILGLPRSLCTKRKWNAGDVASFGCDAIMCKPGTVNAYGRHRPGAPCNQCATADYFGASKCRSSESGSRRLHSVTASAMFVVVTSILLT